MIRPKPDSAQAHWLHGCTLLAQEKPDEAIGEFRAAIRIDPDSAEAHGCLGAVLADQGRADEAITECRTAIRLKPDNAWAHAGLGLALECQGKLEEAIAECRTAIRLKPDVPEAHSVLGAALADQGKTEEALAECRTAIRLKPNSAEPHCVVGAALADQGKAEEAIAEFRTAIQLKPNYAEALVRLAFELVVSPERPRRDYEEGLQHARKAVELVATDADFAKTLALAEYRCGHWVESLAAGKRSMESQNGGDASDWFFQALAHWQTGDKDEARKWFHKAVDWTKEKAPNDVELRRFWEEAAALLGQPGPDA